MKGTIKNVVIGIFMVALTFGTVAMAEAGNYDFKQFRWGDSEELIKSIEGMPGDEVDTSLGHTILYNKEAVGLDAILMYTFNDSGLSTVSYTFTEEHSNAKRYVDDYKKVKETLKNKYGEPIADLEMWDNDDHKARYSDDKDRALEYGFLTYALKYELERTEIILALAVDNNEYTHMLYYNSLVNPNEEPDYSGDI